MSDATLWCVHVTGMDEVHAYATKAEAETAAASMNATIARHVAEREDPASPDWPKCEACVMEWPWGPEMHVVNMAWRATKT